LAGGVVGFTVAPEEGLVVVWEVIREVALRVVLGVVLEIVYEFLVSRR